MELVLYNKHGSLTDRIYNVDMIIVVNRNICQDQVVNIVDDDTRLCLLQTTEAERK